MEFERARYIASLQECKFDFDTLEGRALRAEATAKWLQLWATQLENELRAVDQALLDERMPPTEDRTRMGCIRALGDRSRRAGHEIKALALDVQHLYESGKVTVIGGVQMTVDEVIEDIATDSYMEARDDSR